jgi:hypothetical protein
MRKCSTVSRCILLKLRNKMSFALYRCARLDQQRTEMAPAIRLSEGQGNAHRETAHDLLSYEGSGKLAHCGSRREGHEDAIVDG